MLIKLFEALGKLFEAFSKIGELMEIFLDLIFKIVAQISIVFNPPKLLNEIIVGVVLGTSILFKSLLDKLNITKYLGTTKKESSSRTSGNKCYKLTFLKTVLLLLCPPLGIFMSHGIRQWFNIIICSLLTIYAYYFPGLLYALLFV